MTGRLFHPLSVRQHSRSTPSHRKIITSPGYDELTADLQPQSTNFGVAYFEPTESTRELQRRLTDAVLDGDDETEQRIEDELRAHALLNARYFSISQIEKRDDQPVITVTLHDVSGEPVTA